MKNVLVTGGAGFIGLRVSLKLLEKGYNVTILDNLSYQIHGNDSKIPDMLYGKVNFIIGDIRSKEDFRKALKDQDYVIHLASETGTGQSMYEIYKYCDVNIGGTANLLDIMTNENHKIKKVILSSSRAIYGEGKYSCKIHGEVYPKVRKEIDLLKGDFQCKCPICNGEVTLLSTDENSKIHPLSIYGITKQNQEQMVKVVCKALNIPFVIYRYQNVYGPGQSLNNPYTGILSIFSTRIKNNKDINVFEDGLESRDFVYIDDVVNATVLGLEKDSVNNEIINVGSGEVIEVKMVASYLKLLYQSDINISISGNYRVGDIRHNIADITKLKTKLEYIPEYTFEKGIKLFTKWVNEQEIFEDKYEKSIEEMKEKGLYK